MADRHAPPLRLSFELMQRRLAHFDETRAFYIKMWMQNPHLARQAGARIEAILRPLEGGATPQA